MIILINRIKEIVYRSTVQKILINNITIKSKLDNPVRIYKFVNFFNFLPNSFLIKMFFALLTNTATGDRIVSKTILRLRNNLNSYTYRCKKNLLTFKLDFHLTTIRYFTGNLINKSVYIDKNLTKSVESRLELKKWITSNQKKSLIKHIETCQTNLSAINKEKDCLSNIFYILELLINSLLFQVYVVETISRNKESHTPGIDDQILTEIPKTKIKLLAELKHFKKRKPLPFTRVYISKNKGKQAIIIPCIIDRLVQQLFVLILNPFIESNSDPHSYGFRKSRNQIMIIGAIHKNLQNELKKKNQNVTPIFIWNAHIVKCLDSIYHKWLIKNLPFPFKYKYILKSWIKLGFIEFGSNKIYNNFRSIPRGEIINPLLINFILNGIETLINKNISQYNKIRFKSSIKKFSNGEIELLIKNKWLKRKSKEDQIWWKLYRYSNCLIVLCKSKTLSALIKKKFIKFLKSRGLQINFKKSKTTLFKTNTPFNFLGHTFIWLIRKNHQKNKMGYQLNNLPRIFVYPPKQKIKSLKKRLKTLIKYNQNSSAYMLIIILNFIIRGWVNYYSFSNAKGALNLLRHWLYNKIMIWMKRKHPKSTKIWLNKHYLIIENIIEQEILKYNFKIIKCISNIKSINQIKKNRWNFYGIVWQKTERFFYKIPRINILLWPTNIKNIKIATIFAPKKELLLNNYYSKQEKWLNERSKLECFHKNNKNKSFTFI